MSAFRVFTGWCLCCSIGISSFILLAFFFFNDTATTEIYTLSLHDALPISISCDRNAATCSGRSWRTARSRSEEHTSELQSPVHLVCRLLLEKKNTNIILLSYLKKKKKKKNNQNTYINN